MPEGVATANGQVTAGVADDPEHPPEPGPQAPKGWAWQRKTKSWSPRQRGPVLWRAGSSAADAPDPGEQGSTAAEEPAQQQDPDPSYLHGDSGTGDGPGGDSTSERLNFDEVPQSVKDDMAGLAGLVGTPILAMLRSIDPYCGTVLAQNFEPVVDATLPLICRSKRIVQYFTEDKADWLLWGKLAMALAPVAKAVAEHHIFRTVHVEKNEKTGEITIVRGPRPDSEHGDHLQPPMPEHQYAA